MIINILNGNLLDTEAMELVGERHISLADGRIVPGAFADFVITDVDPLHDLAALADPERTLAVIIPRGQPIRNGLS